MRSSPFLLFSWQRPFLEDLLQYVESKSGGHREEVVILVPNNRPFRYIVDLYGQKKLSGLLPRVVTLEDAVDAWLLANAQAPRPHATLLDSCALLHQSVQMLGPRDELLAEMSGMDLVRFWPWGLRLASLLEELFRQGQEPKNLQEVLDAPSKEAKALLAFLGHIHTEFCERLAQKGLSTPGLDLFRASQLPNIPALLRPSQHNLVLVAGFSVLDGAEERLLRQLWQAGAEICLHTDCALHNPEAALHHACLCHKKWLQRWGAQTQLFAQSASSVQTVFHFHAGYDAHSQLLALQKDLKSKWQKAMTGTHALILARPSLLVPVLHHLPTKQVNISLGYPLQRTLFGQLITILLNLKSRQREDSLFYWRDLLHLLRHPYLQRLTKTAHDESVLDFGLLEDAIAQGQRFQDPQQHLTTVFDDEALCERFREIFQLFLHALDHTETLADLAASLSRIISFLWHDSGIDWKAYPLDLEAIARFEDALLPQLSDALMASEPISFDLQKRLLEELIAQERIPFEADPLTGVQIMGLLETRLLHFDQISILDATDDLLPGTPSQDLLLSEGLRLALKLPGRTELAERTEYTLFRLLANAQRVAIYWQEGVSQGASADGKKIPSRFVEQLIWQLEQQQGKVLGPDDAPRSTAKPSLTVRIPKPAFLPKSPALQARLGELLDFGISPTQLDSFLTCPLGFARHYLLKLKPYQELTEGEAPNLVGQCIHRLLQKLYTPYLGHEISKGKISPEILRQCLDEELNGADLGNLPAISYYILKNAARSLLGKYLEEQVTTTVLALEQKLSTKFVFGPGQATLYGIVDRLDQRQNELVILDYKTGQLKLPAQSFWENRAFLEELSQALSQNRPLEELSVSLAHLREELASLQLPLYLVLSQEYCQKHYALLPHNACLVKLADGGEEKALFEDDCPLDNLERLRACQDILKLTLRCLVESAGFEAIASDHCSYCPYNELCLL
ncbi:MAG: PD-(D/E)XK nuclease family protein [Desulfovibrio sp.]|nr:PD-(D/E)XK nuclease family protein [Desulfovibrio sp.]